MSLLAGKTALIFGVANDHSIAWGIAKAMHEQGARLGFSYAAESLERRVRPLAESIGSTFVEPCDVSDDSQIEDVFEKAADAFGSVDILVHAIAFAGREELSRPYSETSREGFRVAMDISVYSFTALARAAAPLMKNGGAMLTLTYYGAQKVTTNYNVMGVAKAALEASVRYLAADLGPRGIRDSFGGGRLGLQTPVSTVRRHGPFAPQYHSRGRWRSGRLAGLGSRPGRHRRDRLR